MGSDRLSGRRSDRPGDRLKDRLNVLAVCGSLNPGSSNRALLDDSARLAPAGMRITLFEGLRALPHFDPELEAEGRRPEVELWRRAIAASDALLIACPEYGHSLPGSLKNAIDWVIGTAELEGKVVAITASVPGRNRGRRGLKALRVTLGAVSARIIGGEPIPRGPAFEDELRALLGALEEAIAAEAEAA